MALIKKVKLDNGIEAAYWRLDYISLDNINKYGSLSFNLYINPDADDYICMHVTNIDTPELFNLYFSKSTISKYVDVYSACYAFAKDNDSFFKDAFDN